MSYVGSPATRSRGTVGGTVAHAEPSAELPVVALLLGANIDVATTGGHVGIPLDEYLASWVRRPAHIVTSMEVNLPTKPWSWGFSEVSRGFGTGNTAVCGVILEQSAGWVLKASVAVAAAKLHARRLPELESLLTGMRIEGAVPYDAVRASVASLPVGDDPLRGGVAYIRSAMESVLIEAIQAAQARPPVT